MTEAKTTQEEEALKLRDELPIALTLHLELDKLFKLYSYRIYREKQFLESFKQEINNYLLNMEKVDRPPTGEEELQEIERNNYQK